MPMALYNKAKCVQKFSQGSCFFIVGSSVPEPHRLEHQLRLTLLTVIIENCSISLGLTFVFGKNVTTFFALLEEKKISLINDTQNSTPVGTLPLNPWD